MGTRKNLIIVLTALAGALILASCGDSSEGSSPTKEEFVKDANPVCKEFQVDRSKIAYENIEELEGKLPTEAQKEQAVLDLLDAWDEAVAKLADLDPPAGETAEVDAMIEEMESASAKLRQEPENRTIGKTDPFRQANAMTEKYGLKECTL